MIFTLLYTCATLCVYARLLSVERLTTSINLVFTGLITMPIIGWIHLMYVVQETFVFAKTTILFFISRVCYAFKIVQFQKIIN